MGLGLVLGKAQSLYRVEGLCTDMSPLWNSTPKTCSRGIMCRNSLKTVYADPLGKPQCLAVERIQGL